MRLINKKSLHLTRKDNWKSLNHPFLQGFYWDFIMTLKSGPCTSWVHGVYKPPPLPREVLLKRAKIVNEPPLFVHSIRLGRLRQPENQIPLANRPCDTKLKINLALPYKGNSWIYMLLPKKQSFQYDASLELQSDGTVVVGVAWRMLVLNKLQDGVAFVTVLCS